MNKYRLEKNIDIYGRPLNLNLNHSKETVLEFGVEK